MYERIALPAGNLPLLFEGDAVVLGGSFAGVAAALRLAAAGMSVALIEPRTYLGQESTASLRSWLKLPHGHLVEPLESFAGELGAERGVETPFAPDQLKLHLEDRLLEAGVDLLYASRPVSLEVRNGEVRGVVVGNKSGRQLLRAGVVVDALLQGELGPAHEATLARVLEFDGLKASVPSALSVPGGLGVVGDEVVVRVGHRGERHVLVELRLEATDVPVISDAVALARVELSARAIGMAVAEHLMTEVEPFAGAYLSGTSLETAGLPSLMAAPEWAHGAPAGLFRVEPGDVTGDDGLPDLAVSATAGAALAQRVLGGDSRGERTAVSPAGASVRSGTAAADPAGPFRDELRVLEPAPSWRLTSLGTLGVEGCEVPVLRRSEVLVVGGGSSGATAATTAAREGASVTIVDMNPGLGGTGTYGGVHDYWFGRRVGFAGRLHAAVDDMHRRLNHDIPASEVPVWNIEAKAHVLGSQALGAGVDMILDAVAMGVVVEHQVGGQDPTRVRGVVVATRFGPVALLAEVIIDATGDGDIAAWAGAPVVYGSERGHETMWYSLAQYGLPGRSRNNFTSTVDVSDVRDYTRAILAGRRRRRGDKHLHDHGVYVAPRETRHVQGDVVLTLSDQLLKRAWPDTVSVAFSNNDVKGHTTSDWVRVGLISPNLEVEIPYRALLPRDVENVIVVGKAFSATHDALPAVRMQADLENLGGVAGLIAVQALRSGSGLQDLDVEALQERLVADEVLPAWILNSKPCRWRPAEDEVSRLVAQMPFEQPLYAYSFMDIGEVFGGRIPFVDVTCTGPIAVAVLEGEYRAEADPARRLRLAQALAMVGSREGVPALIEAISAELAAGTLPPRVKLQHALAPPDQGAMPAVAYLLHALGLTRDERAVAVWARVVELLGGVTAEDVRDPAKDVFDYVDAVCVGAERLASRSAAPVLLRLHALEPFSGQVSTAPFQVDYFDERQAYLEVVIGRALARCGEPAGVRVLVSYLKDSRALLAAHARGELVRLAGRDHGADEAAWLSWLEEQGPELEPRPDLTPSDAVMVWDQDVLVRA